jgi:hypothetical protein
VDSDVVDVDPDEVDVDVDVVEVEGSVDAVPGSSVGVVSSVGSSEQPATPRTTTARPAFPMSFSTIRLVTRACAVMAQGYATMRFGGA